MKQKKAIEGAVTLRNFLSNLSRNAVVKQAAGPCYTVQSFSATFNIFDPGKLENASYLDRFRAK